MPGRIAWKPIASKTGGGASATPSVAAGLLAELRQRLGLALRPAQVLPKDERVDRDWYHVWLGMDLLGQTREVSLDFKSLTFSLKSLK
jgi:hypothetical protein